MEKDLNDFFFKSASLIYLLSGKGSKGSFANQAAVLRPLWGKMKGLLEQNTVEGPPISTHTGTISRSSLKEEGRQPEQGDRYPSQA